MSRDDIEPLRQILHRALVRYLTVRPRGFELASGAPLRAILDVRILGFGGARTLYENRKPLCRSLDGLRPLERKDRTCGHCSLRPQCTPQVRLDLFAENRPLRLLLAHTSARAFLLYHAQLRARGADIEQILTRIEVLDRGSWGELRFQSCD